MARPSAANWIDCATAPTRSTCVTAGAGLKVSLPACTACTHTRPAPFTTRLFPLIVAAPRTTRKPTASSELAVACRGIGGVPNNAVACSPKIKACGTFATSSTSTTSSAAATFTVPAWFARSVIVPVWPISTSSLAVFNLPALPASTLSVTGSPRFETATTATGPLANFRGTFSARGWIVTYCSARSITRVPVAPPV